MAQIYSMTGFGKAESERDGIQLSIEIKSVNHRFKDIRFKMSSLFAPIELEFRNLLNEHFKRGSFDIYINFKRVDSSTKFDDIDSNKVQSYLDRIKKMTSETGVELSVRPTEFLRSEFLKDQDESFNELLWEMGRELFPKALVKLKESRESEGSKLLKVLKNHRDEYLNCFAVVEEKSDEFQATVKERLDKKFQEFQTKMPVDEPRFMQEVIFYLEKMDIHEEINRIKAHIQKLDSILDKGGELGRQLDFLVQELNRETNTTGSKSTITEISDAVVQMKVHLEKIREQGLNLE